MPKLKAGDKAPDFETVDDQGKKVSLKNFKGRKLVLYFYPKDDTSGCTAQACLFRDHHPVIESRNATVLGVSPDGPESHRRFRAKHHLPFPLLVDSDHAIAQKYGVWGEKSMYGRKYMGIVRSHFVIDEKGKIVDARYKVSPKRSAELAVGAL